MTTARRSSLFGRVEQHVTAVFHGPVDLNGGVVGILDTGRERLPRSVGAAAGILFGPPDPPPPDRPSAWLDVRAGVLPTVPREEVAELLAWCRDPGAPTARLVTGAGGQGKTHLATQVCAALRGLRRGKRWLAGFVTPGGARTAGAARALGRFRLAGALLVVDYAEAQERLVRELLAAVDPRVRVLVLARTTPHWWRELVDSGPRRWAVPEVLHLGTLPDTTRLWSDAVTVFAARLGRTADTTNPPERFATTLDLYASALLRLLDPDISDTDPLSGVLRHERAAFHAAARRAGLADGGWRDLALSTVILREVPGVTAGAEVLAGISELRGLGEHGVRVAAKALAAAYPGDGTSLWRPPAPDRLADTHLLATAQSMPTRTDWLEYVHAVCATADPAVADHVTHVMTRALTTPGADRHYPVGVERLSESVVELARTYAAYVPALARLNPVGFGELVVARIAEIPVETVAAMDAELTTAGTGTSRLAIAVAVSQRLASTDPWHLATLSARLAEAGHLDTALDAAQRAVERVEDPPHRASALTALCHRLAEHDRLIEALAAAEEAADLRRTEPPVVRGYALHNLASRLSDLSRFDEAVTAATEAADLLVAADQDLRPRRAAALVGLAQVLDAAGFPGRAVPPATEAVRLLRELAEDRPDAYLPGLAAAVTVLSRSLAPAEPDRAAELAAEAVNVYTGLAGDTPAAFTPALAAARMNLGLRLSGTGRRAEGLAELRRAVALYEDLAGTAPQAHRAALAAALVNLVLHRTESGDVDLATAERVVALQRERVDPGADLAAALADLGYLRAAAGRFADARVATAQAVAEFRALLAARPSALHRVWLADALLDSARHLLASGQSTADGAEQVRDAVFEAAELYAAIEGEQPDTARSRFREALALSAALDDDRDVPAAAQRYCRRWREAVIRVPLPGMAVLAVVWRTDQAPSRDRTRLVVGDEVLGLGDSPGTPFAGAAAVTAGPALGRLGAGVAERVRLAAARVVVRPAVQPLVQYVQQHPSAVARVAGAVTAAALLFAAIGLDAGRGDEDRRADRIHSAETTAALPPRTSTPLPGASTTPASSGPPTTPAASGTHVVAPSTPPPTHSPAPPPQPDPPVIPPTVIDEPPRPGDIAVDVSGTSYREFAVDNQPGWRDGRRPQGFDLAPGGHQLVFWAGPMVSFTVTAAHTVEYPSAMNGYLTGRGKSVLTAHGRSVSVTANDTSYAGLIVVGTGTSWLSTRTPQTFQVLPGPHQIAVQSGPMFVFTVDDAGHVAYTGSIAPYLAGAGTDALTVRGAPIIVDLKPTDYAGFILIGTDGGWQNAGERRGYRLVPGAHTLLTQDSVQTPFVIDRNGMVSYGDPLEPVLDGRGSGTLTAVGAETGIDAAASGRDLLYVQGAGGWRSTGARQPYHLLPGVHRTTLNNGPTYAFTTDNQGRVDYTGALDGRLAGRGSTTLVVR
ncbi:hypothetical protein [Amycolatopsis sp. CA-128772]|uniref:hypothetical protein n=1 Tax=Amycolatopsis sp. CA-128772 TaxID=2073159 RepID=UPI000CD0B861|nr:hypothetical protein [Amycolatopsis sp. CA-128772]